MSGYVKRRARCPVCNGEFVVTADGAVRWHKGDVYRSGWRVVCEGVGQPAKEESA